MHGRNLKFRNETDLVMVVQNLLITPMLSTSVTGEIADNQRIQLH
jgi:hypothetical protein